MKEKKQWKNIKKRYNEEKNDFDANGQWGNSAREPNWKNNRPYKKDTMIDNNFDANGQ